MDFQDYKSFWNDKASTPRGALVAVDGSHDERTVRLTGAFSAAQARAALDLQAADRVFELGCGVGRIGRELAGEVAHWHGLDISENMLGVARERLAGAGDCAFSALNGPRLDALADASMDKGYCVAVFIHMDKEDFVLYLRDVARVLRPGGLFYFDHWNLAHPVGWRRFALEFEQAAHLPPGQRKDVARNQFVVPQEVEAYVRGAGLEVLAVVTDTPWVQVVARKPDGGDRDQVKAIAAGQCDIAVGNTYYIGQMLDDPEQKDAAESVRIVFPTFEGDGTHQEIARQVFTSVHQRLQDRREEGQAVGGRTGEVLDRVAGLVAHRQPCRAVRPAFRALRQRRLQHRRAQVLPGCRAGLSVAVVARGAQPFPHPRGVVHRPDQTRHKARPRDQLPRARRRASRRRPRPRHRRSLRCDARVARRDRSLPQLRHVVARRL